MNFDIGLFRCRRRGKRGTLFFGVGFDDAVDLAAEGVPVRQIELVSAYEELVIDAFQGVLDREPVFLCAQDDTEWFIVAIGTDLVLEVVEI